MFPKLKALLHKKKALPRVEDCTYENTKEYALRSDSFARGKVLRVIDGDSCEIAILHNGAFLRFNCRMSHVDAPEMKPPLSAANRGGILLEAMASKRFLEDLVLDKVVEVRMNGTDKYGRLLVDVRLPGENLTVNDMIIQTGHGKNYEGGTKPVVDHVEHVSTPVW